MSRLTPMQRVSLFKEKKGESLEFVSGKWFYNKNEINDIIKYLARSDTGQCYFNFADIADLKKWVECYEFKYGTNGYWYDNEIIREGKKPGNIKELAFPLDTYQLKIINILLYHPDEEVLFICSGVGGSGKSTFGNIIQQLFMDDVASCSLSDLSNEFTFAEAIKHRLIYSSEINSTELDNKCIKQLASKERVFANPKNKTGYDVQTQSNLFFNCNVVPRIDLSDTGILRRIIYYSRNTKIEHPDPKIRLKKYTKEELINIARVAYAIDMTNWDKDFEKDTHYLLAKDNSVFICRHCEEYKDYKSLCIDKGLKPYSEPKWREIKDLISTWDIWEPIKDGEEIPF